MDEIIDIVDTENKIIGQANKKEAHTKGFWHRTVNFLLVDSSSKTFIKLMPRKESCSSVCKSINHVRSVNGSSIRAGIGLVTRSRLLIPRLIILSKTNLCCSIFVGLEKPNKRFINAQSHLHKVKNEYGDNITLKNFFGFVCLLNSSTTVFFDAIKSFISLMEAVIPSF